MKDEITTPYPQTMRLNRIELASRALTAGATAWVAVALAGLWLFAVYISLVFAVSLFSGAPQNINESGMITGFVPGDPVGNALVFAHVLPAIVLSVCGVLQFIPLIRRRKPAFHRWNGRLFLTLGLTGALTGLYLTWFRGSRMSDLGALGVTINGLLIPVAVGLAWYYIRKGNVALHQRWAVHAFMLVNGVWFFRLFLMTWYAANQGPLGNTATLDGPADLAISVACYGIPMLLAESYFWAKRHHSVASYWGVTGLLSLATLITAGGILAMVFMMWLPTLAAMP